MGLTLKELAHCFHGVVPALLATADKAGEPNVTFLSHAYYVDESHVALSCQFFNKTRQNVRENPYACIEVNDPFTFQGYRLELAFRRAETSGPLYEAMSARLDTIALHTGMQGIFRLIAADVYEVLSIAKIEGYVTGASEGEAPTAPDPNGPMTEIRSLQLVSSRINAAHSLEVLLDGTLNALHEALGFECSMVLLLDESERGLFTVASHGYGESGIGAEVKIGHGLIGRAAQQRVILRAGGLSTDLRYGRAIRGEMSRLGVASVRPEVPLPGLNNVQSQMALPLLCGDQLLGVLAVESASPLQFEHWHQDFLQIITNHFALAIDRLVNREDPDPSRQVSRSSLNASRAELDAMRGAYDATHSAPAAAMPSVTSDPSRNSDASSEPCGGAPPRHVFWFFPNDDCVFVNGEYLVRNLPGRILWRLLSDFHRAGRREFSNRELRLDESLGLPPIKDNLESRLILLRRRLEEKCPQVRLVPIRRGRFAFEVNGAVELVERNGSQAT